MPMRVKSRPGAGSLRELSPVSLPWEGLELPDIAADDSFREVIKKLSVYFTEAVTLPSTFEQLRTTAAGDPLRVLTDHLCACCTNPAIVNGLLALKWHYATEQDGVSDARANACEIVAWRFLTRLSEREAVDFCLYEIPETRSGRHAGPDDGGETGSGDSRRDERSPLLPSPSWGAHVGNGSGNGSGIAAPRRPLSINASSSKRSQLLQAISRLTMSMTGDGDDSQAEEEEEEDDPTAPFRSLNALEIAAIANAKRFLSQHVVQKIITGIWNGDIIFWDTLSVHAVKRPRYYDAATADPFSRLRVPKYLKCWEVVWFGLFLGLYYAVLVERNPERISPVEMALYVWFAAFFYDELSEWIDAGSIFYAADVWNLFDMIMIVIGMVFAVLRIVGTTNKDARTIELAFDVLSLEALFMVPRLCSILSLSPYWGTLIPCLKEMGKDFIKFMVLVVIVYLGFLTTFSLVGRESFTLPRMTMVLTKIFFGSSYVGFDIMHDIDPVFGPPLMLIFITLSSILLMGSLTGMLSNSFSRVITHAREEYLYVYSVYVLEASTSNRLTHFYPPFNLVALVIFRPLRLFLPSDDKFRAGRIALLKATHLPIVAAIQGYEAARRRFFGAAPVGAGFEGPRAWSNHSKRARPDSSYRPGMPGPRYSDRSMRSHARFSSAPGPAVADSARRGAEDDPVDEPTSVELRVLELSEKIDRLAALLQAMQEQKALVSPS